MHVPHAPRWEGAALRHHAHLYNAAPIRHVASARRQLFSMSIRNMTTMHSTVPARAVHVLKYLRSGRTRVRARSSERAPLGAHSNAQHHGTPNSAQHSTTHLNDGRHPGARESD